MPNFIEKVGAVSFNIEADGKMAMAEIDKIEKKAEKSEGKFTKISKGLKVTMMALGGLIAGAFSAFVAWMRKAIPLASNFQEANSKMLTVFKDIKKEASATAKALTQYGFSLSDATSAIADTGDVLTGLGMGQQEALKLSDTIARLGQDLTSFTNYSGGTQQAIQVLTKGILGERDGLVSLGIKLNETELKRKGYNDSLSMQEKAEITIQAIMEQSKNAMGDYGRTQDQYANQQRKLAANFKDLSVTVAQKLLPSLTGLTKWMNKQFEKSEDLEETTSRLTNLLKRRKEITDKLSGSIGELNEEQERSLKLDELNIQNEINNVIKRLTKTYSEFFAVNRYGTREIAKSNKLEMFAGGKTEIEAMKNLQIKLNEEYIKSLDTINKWKVGTLDYNTQLSRANILNEEAIRIGKEVEKIELNKVSAVKELAIALKNNVLTSLELARFPEQLRNEIIKMSNDPGLLAPLEKQAKKKGASAGKSYAKAWTISFLDKIDLKESVGAQESDILKELQEYIDVNQKYFDKYQKELLATGKLNEGRTKFLKEYVQVQEKLVSLLEKEKKLVRDSQRESGNAPVSLGSSPREGGSTRSRGGVNGNLDDTLGKLQQAIDLAKTFAKALGVEASESAGKLSSLLSELGGMIPGQAGMILQAAGAVFELTSGIINAIEGEVDMNTEWKKQQKEIDTLNTLLDATNTRLNTMKTILSTIELANKLGVDDLGEVKDILTDMVDELQLSQEAIANQFNLEIDDDGIIKDLDKIKDKVTSVTDEQINVSGLLRQLEGIQDRVKNNIFKGDFLSEKDQALIESIANQLVNAGAITRDMADRMIAERAGSVMGISSDIKEVISRAITETNGKLGELQSEINALSKVAGNNKELLENLEQLRLLALTDMSKELVLMEKENNVLKATGENTEQNLTNQLELIDQMLEQYEALNESGQYQTEIYDLMIKQAQLRSKLEEKTADSMKDQLDIMNKLKGTGLFDEQNLYQVGLLGGMLDRQGSTFSQKMDVFQSLNVDGLASQRTLNVGSIEVNVNEAMGDTLESAVDQRMISIIGGL